MTAALIEESRKLTWPHDTPHDAERAKVIEALCDALEAAERERDALSACLACPKVGCELATVQLCADHADRVPRCPECGSWEYKVLNERPERQCMHCSLMWTDHEAESTETIAEQDRQIRQLLQERDAAKAEVERLKVLADAVQRWDDACEGKSREDPQARPDIARRDMLRALRTLLSPAPEPKR